MQLLPKLVNRFSEIPIIKLQLLYTYQKDYMRKVRTSVRCGGMQNRKNNPYCSGNARWHGHWRKFGSFLQNWTHTKQPSNLPPRHFPKWNESLCSQKGCTWTFRGASFINAKNYRNNPNVLQRWMEKQTREIHTMEYHSAKKETNYW